MPIDVVMYGGHRLRVIPTRVLGQPPWWIIEDIAECIAALLDRDVSETIREHFLAACPAGEQMVIAIIGADEKETTATAAAEIRLTTLITGLVESNSPALASFGRWFHAAAPSAAEATGVRDLHVEVPPAMLT
jgi:hypothetical protein